ncbi:MAG TPA: DUF1501 domain-containing protein [Pirellulaceae bacterium]|nr:DUF1501 domain-containing protein [Pirellulaceae bacterium]
MNRKRMTNRGTGSIDRRDWLGRVAGGFGAIAADWMLAREGSARGDEARDRPEGPYPGLHHGARVRRVIQLFMNGGTSQVDTFDYKPELERQHGKQLDFGIAAAATSPIGTVMRSPFGFRQYGESGRWVSDVLPEMAKRVDRLAFLMAMQSKTSVHGPASYLQNTGSTLPGFPSFGAWLSYGLGSLTDELPTYVVLPDPRGLPYNNTGNFSSGFLPAAHAATVVRPWTDAPIPFLEDPRGEAIGSATSAARRELLDRLNADHLARHPGEDRLEARIASFELAAKLQSSAPAALDLADETPATRAAYGLDDATTEAFGRNCLTARRLIERGVRFVQVWSGAGGPANNWDNHTDIVNELPAIARQVDRPIGALLDDLQERGLLDDTLVIWTTEFGRMPFTQGATGRDHNGGTFVSWLSGAGVRGGASIGASDDFGFRAVESVTTGYDLHATVLHLMGIDHERLTWRHNGLDRRLTDVHGHVLRELLV